MMTYSQVLSPNPNQPEPADEEVDARVPGTLKKFSTAFLSGTAQVRPALGLHFWSCVQLQDRLCALLPPYFLLLCTLILTQQVLVEAFAGLNLQTVPRRSESPEPDQVISNVA
jgi:hypothetical protein